MAQIEMNIGHRVNKRLNNLWFKNLSPNQDAIECHVSQKLKQLGTRQLDASLLDLKPFAVFVRLLIKNGMIPDFRENNKQHQLRSVIKNFSPNRARCLPKLSRELYHNAEFGNYDVKYFKMILDLFSR